MAGGRRPSPFWGKQIDVRNGEEVEALRRWHHGTRGRRTVKYGDDGLAESSGYARKPSKSKMKTLTDSLGRQYKTPDEIDYDDFVDMFRIRPEGQLTEEYKNKPVRENMRSLADWCSWSFDRDNSGYYSFSCPAGHIEKVDYNNTSKIMRVKFRSGDGETACYFYVPADIYFTLEHLSDGMPTRKDRRNIERHLVGIYFWDLVRIRGTVHGNRYQCCYVTSGDGGGYVKSKDSSKEYVEFMKRRDEAERRSIENKLRNDGQDKAADALGGKHKETDK